MNDIQHDFNQIFRLKGDVSVSKKRMVHIEHREIGTLAVVTGGIVACDPATGGEPFTEQIHGGHFPVVLTVVTEHDDPRVACARLLFEEEIPASWTLATWPEKQRRWFDRGQPTGYGVDSATGCFMDARAEEVLRTYAGLKRPEYLSNALVMDETLGPTCNWGNAILDDTTNANVIVFSAGNGDGYYSSYWGYSAQGEIVALVTDFGILDIE